MAKQRVATKTDEADGGRLGRLLFGLSTIWVFGIVIIFFTSDLPNSADFDTRLTFLLLWPEVWAAIALPSPGSSFISVFERLPYWLVASAVVSSAVATGDLLLKRFVGDSMPSGETRVGLAGGLGLTAISLVTLALGVTGLLSAWIFWPLLVGPIVARLARRSDRQNLRRAIASVRVRPKSALGWFCAASICVFGAIIVLGASLPSVDFDVREYHLQGPKEYFQNGSIGFLEHNVYTSFPFQTEMLSLSGMVLCNDWWGGAIVGKVVLASYALFSSLLLLGLGRSFENRVGWAAVLFWVTSPWCYRASTIAYTEGALAYYVLAVLVACLWAARQRTGHWWGVAGLLAGSAMACKYPGLVQAVLPAGLASMAAAFAAGRGRVVSMRQRIGFPIWFAIGVAIVFGPWAIKNVAETGNPVYPLAYSIFGGVDLDDAWAAKWAGGHSPPFNVLADPARAIPDFFASTADVFIKNDWQTPFVALFAPLACLVFVRRKPLPVVAALIFTAWLYVMWWALTHRIDRFWVPMLPVVCFVAAVGVCWPRFAYGEEFGAIWRRISTALVVFVVAYHYSFVAVGQAGFQQWLAPYASAKRQVGTTERGIQLLNETLPAGSKPLLVGEAQVFDLKVQPVYNTVFDDSIFQQIASGDRSVDDAEQPTASRDVLCGRLTGAGVTHVFVNWSEVLRYRESYGYTDFVAPKRFVAMVNAGVLREVAVDAEKTHLLWDDLNESTQREIDVWGPEIHVKLRGHDAFKRFELFEVVCE